MNTKHKNLAFLAGSLLLMGLGAGLTGCVEQEVSMSLAGSVAYEGSIDEETGELVCDQTSAQPGSVEIYFTSANLDLSEGRPLVFNAEIVNLLESSSQGAGGETFPGIRQDQNSITVTKATISFPAELNDFAGAGLAETYLKKTELFTAVLESSGGAAIVTFPLIGSRQFGAARTFYEEALAAAGLDPATQDAIIPLVAEIQIEGQTFGGQVVESNAFQFPVSLCMNCELATTPICIPTE
jgi:hypothetical protein